MARRSKARNRVGSKELDQYLIGNVQLTNKELGTGAYGSVEEVKIPGATAAAKKLHRQLVTFGSPIQVDKWINDFLDECKLMSKLRHPNIVQFLGICYFHDSELPVLLMEKLQTSLDSLLEGTPNIPIEMKVHILIGTASGLVCLHSQTPPIAHRDLTARNILIDSNLNAKITDLGVSRMVTIQPGQLAATMTGGPGNLLYMPPEAQAELTTKYNVSIDIFSFGVTSLFTLTQVFPSKPKPHNYPDPKTKKLIARTEIERREDYIAPMKASLGKDNPLVKLTLDCLHHFPKNRPSAEAVLRRLEGVREKLPKEQSKLELVRRIAAKESEIQHKDAGIKELQEANNKLQVSLKQSQHALIEKEAEIECLRSKLRVQHTEKSPGKSKADIFDDDKWVSIPSKPSTPSKSFKSSPAKPITRRNEPIIVNESKELAQTRQEISQLEGQLMEVECMIEDIEYMKPNFGKGIQDLDVLTESEIYDQEEKVAETMHNLVSERESLEAKLTDLNLKLMRLEPENRFLGEQLRESGEASKAETGTLSNKIKSWFRF